MDIDDIREHSDINFAETYYDIISTEDKYRINKNYEIFISIIDESRHIIKILKEVVESKLIESKTSHTTYKDNSNFEILRLKKDSKIYKGLPWFYPSTFKNTKIEDDGLLYPQIYSEILPAAKVALLQGGGVNCYIVSRDLRLFVLNDLNVKNLIKKYLNPLLKHSSNKEYFSKIIDIINKKYIKNDNSKGDIIENMEIMKLIKLVIKYLGYDGTYALENTCIYSNNEYMINDNLLLNRYNSDKYDWEQWKINEDFLLDINSFNMNLEYYLKDNIGLIVYEFYKKMLSPSIKLENQFDFGTLNVNMFHSINSKDSIKDCIEGIKECILTYKLKFLCVQNIDIKYIQQLSSLLEAENLCICQTRPKGYNKSHCIISKSKLEIIDIITLPNYGYYITFTHPNYKDMTFLTTSLNTDQYIKKEQIDTLKISKADVIMGTLGINYYQKDNYKHMSSIGYSVNDNDLEATSPSDGIIDYILLKLPLTLSICIAMNYKYSNHRLVLGKF